MHDDGSSTLDQGEPAIMRVQVLVRATDGVHLAGGAVLYCTVLYEYSYDDARKGWVTKYMAVFAHIRAGCRGCHRRLDKIGTL